MQFILDSIIWLVITALGTFLGLLGFKAVGGPLAVKASQVGKPLRDKLNEKFPEKQGDSTPPTL